MTDKWLIINPWEIALVPVVIAAILGLMASVRFCAGRFGIAPELQRKIIHVAVGASSLFFPLIFSSPLPVFILIACALAVMFKLRGKKARASGGMGSVLHQVDRPSYGEIYLALSVAFLFFRLDGQAVLYVLPLLVVTLSDTASALIGTAYGRMRFAVPDGTKSIEGVIAFFVVTWICGMILLLLMSDTGRMNVIILSFLIAAFCATLEADSWRGLDNLLVPVGAHLLLERHLYTGPEILLGIAAIFTVAVLIAVNCAKYVGLTKHAVRSYAVMLFLLVTFTNGINAILPAAAILAHIYVRKYNPGRSRTPELDFLAAGTACGLIWLLIGEALGQTTITFFNLSFAGVAMIFVTLAARRDGASWWAHISVLPVAALLFGICAGIAYFTPAHAFWYGGAIPPIAVSIGLCMAAAFIRPRWFTDWRSPKAFGVAFLVPTILLVADGVML
ncbi:diacylglycerol/polyprenol kinase family protein [Sphingorhabdus arenilitoris]|uniref:Diacylglycerol/polyprenol kinase family protein n=1 Tax=Sphingorhabdus arenilitoris TaxID=1490041 RepID=A0ABV8RIZ3_9SPHN